MRQQNEREDGDQLDPIALTLALWLGMVVAATGLIRLSENAAAQATMAQVSAKAGAAPDDAQPFNPRAIALGG